MRVLITGGSGFVGAPAVAALLAAGAEVHALGRRPVPGAVHHAVDLLDAGAVRAAVAAAGASHLLHLAWDVTPGRYWRSGTNLDWVAASLGLVRAFAACGGRRVVVAGSCAEYAWGPPRLSEAAVPAPATLYGVAKDALHRMLASFGAEAGVSVGWGRLFYLYGPGEAPGRLVHDAVATLSGGGRLATSHGRQRRDFMHVRDAAGGLVAVLLSAVEGPVNIGTGDAVAVRAVLEAVAAVTGGAERIDFGARPLPATEPPCIEADAGRLRREVGFVPRFGLADGVADTVAWWRGGSGGLGTGAGSGAGMREPGSGQSIGRPECVPPGGVVG